MSVASVPTTSPQPSDVPLLENGDRLTQAEFHRRYKACPDHVKAELIGGIVYMPSPLRRRHATHHLKLGLVLGLYEAGTPGIEALDNATTILGEASEPQPDLAVRILPEWGGQSWTDEDDYVTGPPEFVAEIAHSSVAIDMHQKREDYLEAGVLEYLVVCLEERELHWFSFKSRRSVVPDRRGVYRSVVFPGLWLDGEALLDRDSQRLIEVVQKGLASKQHTVFVKRLKAAHRRHS